MKLKPILGLQLKDPQIVELLNAFDTDVVYSFDRFFENQPDRYIATATTEGLEFHFDERQRLVTIFVYVRGNSDFSPHDPSGLDLDRFNTIEDARVFATKNDLAHKLNTHSTNVPDWLRIDYPDYSIHYGFGAEGLSIITLMDPKVVPGAP